MYVLITLGLFALTIAIMVGLRISRSPASYSWMASTMGSLLAWGSIMTWQLDLPHRFFPSIWTPTGLYSASPVLLADTTTWLYALSLASLAAAVILTSPARASSSVNPAAWAGTLALTALGTLAVLADNPLTLVLGWTAIDLTEFINTLRASDSPSLSERTVISFTIRAIGTAFALWASVVHSITGQSFLFENTTAETGIFLLMASGLRLGVLPLHLTYRSEPMLRRGFGTVLRLMTAATSLILLARLPASALNFPYIPLLLTLVGVAGLYASWKWFWAADEMNGRPYWIIGMSALSLSAALRGNPTGSAAWGVTLVLFGGISFLYSARQIWFTRILAGLSILLMAVPFSLTATGWNENFPWPFFFWPLFLMSHFMLVAGYIRHLFQPGETNYAELPTWAQSAYPAGLGLLIITVLLVGFWGWPGALQIGNWAVGAISISIFSLVGFAMWRFRTVLKQAAVTTAQLTPRISLFGTLLEMVARVIWAIYRLASQLVALGANLLEGDGGLLWTLLLLVLFIIFAQQGGG